jgi:hypothetical protein
MDRDAHVAAGLATALLAGPWTAPGMRTRVSTALGTRRPARWVHALVEEVLAVHPMAPVDAPRELAAAVQLADAFQRRSAFRPALQVRVWTPRPTGMGRTPWPVTPLPDLAALARLLDLDAGELAWFADNRGWTRRGPEPLRHYRWREVPRRGGGTRLVAAPKPRLKEIQRRLLRHVLLPIPTHAAAHGAVAGRSVRTAVTPHAGSAVVLRMDLEAFYASIPAGRVWGLLRTAGFPEAVAYTITGLVTTRAPVGLSSDPRLRTPHLPQGAPSSPQLANLITYPLDRRLTGLAERFGARYTRYVDDLTFSGGSTLRTARARFVDAVGSIVRSEGFTVNERKTVVLGDAGRQQVLGATVNVTPAVPRPERDALRATLHNCAVRGWAAQARGRSREEFRAHLLGRVAWVGGLHPEHGRRLRAIADRIDWTAS